MTPDQMYEEYKGLERDIRTAIEEGLVEAKGLNRNAQANFCTQRVMDCLEGMINEAGMLGVKEL